tara:strand:+ start:3421 stop:3588 length:168 start_codon:yes stop_codon:yes gene_type:complete
LKKLLNSNWQRDQCFATCKNIFEKENNCNFTLTIDERRKDDILHAVADNNLAKIN